MEKIRIAHMADFHLGGELTENRELSEQINSNLIKSLVEIFSMLNASKVDLVLIAGDFYETSAVNSSLLRNIKEIFESFRGQIVIAPGNHDYVSLESVYHGEWPSNTHIFTKRSVDYFEFSELNTRVYGFAFTSSHVEEPVLSSMPILDERFINIGLFHGQIDSNFNMYHPIFLSDIENSNLDYLALGHVHKRSTIKRIGRTYYAYSGNPVGRGFDETGAKGIYLGDISKTRNGLNFYRVDNKEFHIVNIKIEIFDSQLEIANEIDRYLQENFGSNYKRNYYRIFINGFIKKEENLNLDIIQSHLSDFNYIELFDKTSIYIDIDELSKQDSLKGIFVQNALKEIQLNSSDLNKILDYGIKAFEDLL